MIMLMASFVLGCHGCGPSQHNALYERLVDRMVYEQPVRQLVVQPVLLPAPRVVFPSMPLPRLEFKQTLPNQRPR